MGPDATLSNLATWADLNRPKEGSVEPPNGQTAKLDEFKSPKLETEE